LEQFFLHSFVSLLYESEKYPQKFICKIFTGGVVMLFEALCENLESIHETEERIRHKEIQTALHESLQRYYFTYFSYSIFLQYFLHNFWNAVGFEYTNFGVSAFVEVQIGSGGRA
jgi:hypothetical protein